MTEMSQCNRCNRAFPAAPVGTIHKCQCSGGMMQTIPSWEPHERFEITGRGLLCTGPYPFTMPEPMGRLVYIDSTLYEVAGYERLGVWAPMREGVPCGLLVKPYVEPVPGASGWTPEEGMMGSDSMELRENYHTELIKRAILAAHIQITQGLGMSQAARLAADEIITLFDPNHKRMEPFCNCPTGIHDDAFDPGGPMSGMPRPYCPLHNTNPRKR